MTLAVAAVVAAAGLAAYAAVDAVRLGVTLGIVGAAGVAVLAAAMALRLRPLVAPALPLLGAEFTGLFVVRGDTVDVRAPLYGAGFFAVAELAYAALELRAGRPEPGLIARRVLILGAVALGGILVGLIVLAAGAAPLDGGLGLEVVGIAATLALVLALGRTATRSR